MIDGVGTVDVMLEMRQLVDNKGRRTIGRSAVKSLEFDPERRLWPHDTAFLLKQAPFREAGLYEFYLTADGRELPGETFVLRVLDRGGM